MGTPEPTLLRQLQEIAKRLWERLVGPTPRLVPIPVRERRWP